MTASNLVVVVDRGGLKAYHVQPTPTRGLQLDLIQAFEIPNLNDLSRNRHTAAVNDWPQLEIEETQRICNQLAIHIAQVVEQSSAEGWSLAAPESIYGKILPLLPNRIRERIVEHVESDLRNTPVRRLAGHFRSLQPI